MVFVQDPDGGSGKPDLGSMSRTPTESVKVLTVASGIFGVLKHDPLRPRIPWGVPAKVIADATGLLATARSARTVRGLLRLWERFGAENVS